MARDFAKVLFRHSAGARRTRCHAAALEMSRSQAEPDRLPRRHPAADDRLEPRGMLLRDRGVGVGDPHSGKQLSGSRRHGPVVTLERLPYVPGDLRGPGGTDRAVGLPPARRLTETGQESAGAALPPR
jgi:hypothetical protein